jgi:hypothetical protein
MGSTRFSKARGDDWDDDWLGEDWSDDGDDGLDEGSSPCPECGAAISSLIDKCPQCGYWLTEVDRRTIGRDSSRPYWQRLTAAMLLLAFLLCLLMAGIFIF